MQIVMFGTKIVYVCFLSELKMVYRHTIQKQLHVQDKANLIFSLNGFYHVKNVFKCNDK